jgi:hypothetical protein
VEITPAVGAFVLIGFAQTGDRSTEM